jgi:hypothetical protein
MADYLAITETSGNLRALCPDCGTLMHRRAAFAKLNILGVGLDIAFPQAVPRIKAMIASVQAVSECGEQFEGPPSVPFFSIIKGRPPTEGGPCRSSGECVSSDYS